jgi:hypothetical protein
MTTTINADTSIGIKITSDTSGVMGLQTAGNTAVTIDGSQNVGIGTTSPAQTLHVKTSTSATPITLGVLSNATGLPALSFNGAYASTTMAGIYGNGATASNLYYTVPASQNHYFAIADSTKMTLDASGNLGLGVTPSASSWPSFENKGGTLSAYSDAAIPAVYLTANAYYNIGWKYKSSASNRAFLYSMDAYNGILGWSIAAAGTAGNAITFTQAMTLNASGNLSVGDTNSSGRITAIKAGTATIAGLDTTAYAAGVGATLDLGGNYRSTGDFQTFVRIAAEKANATNADYGYGMGFYVTTNSGSTFGTKAMTIDSSGNLLVGTTSAAGYKFNVVATGSYAGNFTTASSLVPLVLGITSGTGSQIYQYFFNGATNTGSISTTGTNTLYNSVSDYRLKENIAPMTGALSVVQQLKPCTYTWKADGSVGQGFVAHELQAVFPDCVSGEKDGTREEPYEVTPEIKDEQGNIVTPAEMGRRTVPAYQGIDTSFLVATLTAAIQEQQVLITQLQADVAALKGA